MFSRLYLTAVFCFLLVLAFKGLQSRITVNRPKVEKFVTKSDLIVYLDALNRILDFTDEHKNDIDINIYFGLFLVNVNIKRALQEKFQVLPEKLRVYIIEIVRKTDQLLSFWTKYTFNQDDDLRNKKYKAIFSLLVNDMFWINRLPNFNATFFNRTGVFNLNKKYSNWMSYRKCVDGRNMWVPSPNQSDLCLVSLAVAEKIHVGKSWRCRVLKSCYEMLQNGTDFGYALAHRLLFLQHARLARGCDIFSEQEDSNMRRRFCSIAYQEVEFIALHDFEIIDLLLEHVCLCALEGHAQFLRRSWLTKILTFQTPYGCFSHVFSRKYKLPCSGSPICMPRHDYDMLEDCNRHITAVAAGTLAIASRLILEIYY